MMRGEEKEKRRKKRVKSPREVLKKKIRKKKEKSSTRLSSTGAGLAGQRRRCEGLERGLYLDLAGGVNCGRPRGGSTLLIASMACGL